jgi:hypothetical protein
LREVRVRPRSESDTTPEKQEKPIAELMEKPLIAGAEPTCMVHLTVVLHHLPACLASLPIDRKHHNVFDFCLARVVVSLV